MTESEKQGLHHTTACKDLLGVCFDLLNLLDGKPIPHDARSLADAHTLAKKVVMHIETVLHLASIPKPDHASIAILIRAAYESLLLFNYLFIDPAATDERRYERWKLCGLRARSDIKGFVDPRSAEEVAADRKVMSDLENEIRSIVTSDGRIKTNGTLEKFNPGKYRKWKPGCGMLWPLLRVLRLKKQRVFTRICAHTRTAIAGRCCKSTRRRGKTMSVLYRRRRS